MIIIIIFIFWPFGSIVGIVLSLVVEIVVQDQHLMFSQGNAQIVSSFFYLLLFTVFELGMAKVQILARTNRILFGALRFLDALQVLSHRVDRTVHVQQFAIQILFGSVVRLATTRKTESIIRFVELVSSLHSTRREIKLEQFRCLFYYPTARL